MLELWASPNLTMYNLDLGPTWKNISNGTSTHDGEQLYKFILKSFENCRSYGLDKRLTFSVTLKIENLHSTKLFKTLHPKVKLPYDKI